MEQPGGCDKQGAGKGSDNGKGEGGTGAQTEGKCEMICTQQLLHMSTC